MSNKITQMRRMPEAPKIAQIGAGVVGNAAGEGFLAKGFDVVFVDIDPLVLTRLRNRRRKAVTIDRLDGSDIDIFLISVPTYVGGPDDVRAVLDVSRDLSRILREKSGYSVVVIRSSVLPGTTEHLVIPTLERYSGKRVGRDFGVCVNPEYLREKSAGPDFLEPPAVVIGEYDKRSGDLLGRIYRWVDCPVERVGLRDAEMQKFVHNVFNSAKISFFNEVRKVCDMAGVDADRIFSLVCLSAEGMWNPAYGTRDFGPFDGMCLPKDSRAFLGFSEKVVGQAKVVRATVEVNRDLEREVKRQPRALDVVR